MGFLDNSNANIIVDAVLTDLGRRLLAANDNSFSIRRFSLADDEVDYGIITQFGLSVGKEKIEKNTPVFEAQTNSDLALKYNCVSLSAVALTSYPTLSLSNTGGSTISGNFVNIIASSTSQSFTQVRVSQNPPSGFSDINAELREDGFYVKVNRRFLAVNAPVDYSQPNGVDVYFITATSAINPFSDFRLATVLANTSTDFATYGNGSTITTPVKIVGVRTGITTDLNVSISKSS
jgi:hypothetical protein